MEYDELQRENERLRAEKRTLINNREERADLVVYVKDELSYRKAGLGKRVKWRLFGKDRGIYIRAICFLGVKSLNSLW